MNAGTMVDCGLNKKIDNLDKVKMKVKFICEETFKTKTDLRSHIENKHKVNLLPDCRSYQRI